MKFFPYFAWAVVVVAAIAAFCWLIYSGHPWASIVPAVIALSTELRIKDK